MKTLSTAITLVFLWSLGSFAQDNLEQKLNELESGENISALTVDNGENKNASIETNNGEDSKLKSSDTTTIRFGKRRIVIIEKDGSTTIEVPERNEFRTYDKFNDNDFTFRKAPKFRGHWAGFEWGFNGLMDKNKSIVMKDDLQYLELKQGRSWNLNLNILQYSLGFGTDKIGLVTGLGFEFNNYHFRNSITLTAGAPITGVDSMYINEGKSVSRSRLSTTHLTLPLLLEFQIPTSNDRHRVFFSTGVIGGVRIGSHTKVVYDSPSKGKDKVRDDFNLASFRYGLTARVGYRSLKLYANYYPTALFEDTKGPEVYPFSLGLILVSF